MSNLGPVQKSFLLQQRGLGGPPPDLQAQPRIWNIQFPEHNPLVLTRVVRCHPGGGKGGEFGGLNKATEFRGQPGQPTIAANTLQRGAVDDISFYRC